MLRDLNFGEMKSGVLVLVVFLVLEGKVSYREMIFKFFFDFCGIVMSISDVEKLFDKLLKDLFELVLDIFRVL